MNDLERMPERRAPFVSIGEVIERELTAAEEPVNPDATLGPIIEHLPLDPGANGTEHPGTPDGFIPPITNITE